MFLGPVLEDVFLSVEANQFVLCADKQFIFLFARQDTEDVVGDESGIVCLVIGQFSGWTVVYPESVSMSTDVSGASIRLVDAVDASQVG